MLRRKFMTISAGTKTCFVGAILIVINFLLNIGLYNLMIN